MPKHVFRNPSLSANSRINTLMCVAFLKRAFPTPISTYALSRLDRKAQGRRFNLTALFPTTSNVASLWSQESLETPDGEFDLLR